jgi:hypothetical protein
MPIADNVKTHMIVNQIDPIIPEESMKGYGIDIKKTGDGIYSYDGSVLPWFRSCDRMQSLPILFMSYSPRIRYVLYDVFRRHTRLGVRIHLARDARNARDVSTTNRYGRIGVPVPCTIHYHPAHLSAARTVFRPLGTTFYRVTILKT